MPRTVEAALLLRLDDMYGQVTLAQRSIRFKLDDPSESIELALRGALREALALADEALASV